MFWLWLFVNDELTMSTWHTCVHVALGVVIKQLLVKQCYDVSIGHFDIESMVMENRSVLNKKHCLICMFASVKMITVFVQNKSKDFWWIHACGSSVGQNTWCFEEGDASYCNKCVVVTQVDVCCVKHTVWAVHIRCAMECEWRVYVHYVLG